MADDLIFDVGMHDGQDTAFYLRKGFRVVAVEASPELVEAGQRRFAPQLSSGQLTIVAAAIAEDEGPITFYRCAAPSIWSTTDRSYAERAISLGARVEEITVPGIPFARLLGEHGTPYYLKIDIEGADMICLRQLLPRRERPKFMSIESSKAGMAAVREEFELFGRLGYRGFKIVAQHRIFEQKLPCPEREGAYVEHDFVVGCSGAFGRELPGRWLSAAEAIRRYRWIQLRYRLTGEAGVITSIPVIRRSLNEGRLHPGSPVGRMVRHAKRVFRPLIGGWFDTHAVLG